MNVMSLAQLLARLFADASAPNLLERAGLPVNKFPPWGNLKPEDYWETVVRELEEGVVVGGLDALLDEARRPIPAMRTCRVSCRASTCESPGPAMHPPSTSRPGCATSAKRTAT